MASLYSLGCKSKLSAAGWLVVDPFFRAAGQSPMVVTVRLWLSFTYHELNCLYGAKTMLSTPRGPAQFISADTIHLEIVPVHTSD